jgi:hypothetical protein
VILGGITILIKSENSAYLCVFSGHDGTRWKWQTLSLDQLVLVRIQVRQLPKSPYLRGFLFSFACYVPTGPAFSRRIRVVGKWYERSGLLPVFSVVSFVPRMGNTSSGSARWWAEVARVRQTLGPLRVNQSPR